VTSNSNLNLPGSTQRADLVNTDVQTLGHVYNYFDPLAFKPVTAVRFGNLGFNSLRGPGVANMDLSIARDFQINDRFKAQFRFESFNFTNTPHFATPDNSLGDANNVDPKTGRVTDPGSFMTITGVQDLAREGIDERQFRLGLRIRF
jgi:hypothetical protein